MKKIIALFIFCFAFLFANENYEFFLKTATKEANYKNYPIKKFHQNLNFKCQTCHEKIQGNNYSIVTTKRCLKCHKSYDALSKRSGFLGYDDNVHASPHYPDMDCNLCHSSHKKSTNYCVMCHSQDSMKNLLVP